MTETATPILTTAAPAPRVRRTMAGNKQTSPEQEEWLTAKQVAERLSAKFEQEVKLSRVQSWLYRKVFKDNQRLITTSVNRHYEVRASALEGFELPKPGPKTESD